MDILTLALIGLALIAFAVYPFMPYWRFQKLSSRALQSLGELDYEQCLEDYRALLNDTKNARPKNVRDAYEFVARQGMGTSYFSLARFEEAEPELGRAVALLEAGVEQQPIVVLSTRFEYASCLDITGQPNACDQQLQKIRETLDALPPEKLNEGLDHLRCRTSSACLTHQFDLEDKLRELVTSYAQKADPPLRDLIVRCALDHAMSLSVRWRHRDATDVVEQALNRYDDLDDSTLLAAWRSLSTAASMSGDQEKAVEYSKRALGITRELGSEVDVLVAEMSLAGQQHLYGNDREAVPRAQKAFARLSEMHHPDSTSATSNGLHAMPLLLVSGDFETANDIFVRVERKPKEQLRRDGVNLTSALIYRCFFFLEVRRPQEALEAAEEVITEFRDLYPERDPMASDCATGFPFALIQLKRLEEARQAIDEIQAARLANTQQQILPLDRVNFALMETELAYASGNFEQTLVQGQKGIELIEANVLPTHEYMPLFRLLMGKALVGLGRASEALPLFEKAESLRAQYQPPDHFAFADLYEAWGDALQATGDTTKADELQSDALKIRERWSSLVEESVQQWRCREQTR